MQETGFSTALLSPLGTYDDEDFVCRGFTGSPSTTKITKRPGLEFSALLAEDVTERLELTKA
jgi:hypothetical protein